MNKRATFALSVLTIAAGCSGLILYSGMDGAIAAKKARIFAGLVRPLVDAFGTMGAIAVLMGLGLMGAAAAWFWPRPAGDTPDEPASAPAERKIDPLNRPVAKPWYETIVAAAPAPRNERKAELAMSVNEILEIDSEPLRALFRSAMHDGDLASSELSDRRKAAFGAAFGDDPFALTLELYALLPVRRRIPTAEPELRRLGAAFDAALACGWHYSLTGQFDGGHFGHRWQVRLASHAASLRFSEAQLRRAIATVGRLIAGGATNSDETFNSYYYFVIRAAAQADWPKHRDDLIAAFSCGFTAHGMLHSQVLALTEDLLKETPLAREDVPELVEFDAITAERDAVRASVFAELGEPLGQAMAEVLDAGSGLIDRNKYPALRALQELSGKQRGACFVQLLATLTGLERHGIDHWEKLRRERGRYRLGLNYDPGYSIFAEMSFLFIELTRKKLVIPDRDRVVGRFMDILPLLIYLQDRQSVEVVLDTATKAPHGETADKLRALVATRMEHPFSKYRAAIEGTLALYPEKGPVG